MDLTPLYELRTCLRASIIAGAALAGGDFRLRRAVDNFASFEKAAPVFTKLGQLCRSALDPACPDRAGDLLDAITLADAVLCTQAAVDVSGEVDPLEITSGGAVLSNAPYSVLAPLLEALTTSGSGKFSFVVETHDQRPALFDDYRVREALVKALGAGYSELAEKAREWLTAMGDPVLPLLMSGFDPQGKRDMVRRVQVIEAIAGAKANDFYLQNIPEAEKDVRGALVFALRLDEGNAEKLIELFQTEKGPAKRMAGFALARMDCPAANEFWLSSEKQKKQALSYAALSKTSALSRIVAEALGKCLEPFEADRNAHLGKEELEQLQNLLYLLHGKHGPEICDIYRRMAALIPVMDNKPNPLPSKDQPKARFEATDIGSPRSFSGAIAELLRRAILYDPAPDLLALADELRGENAYFTAAGIMADFLSKGAEVTWKNAANLFRLPPKLYGVSKPEVLSEVLENIYWDGELHRTCVRAALGEPAIPGNTSSRRNFIHFRRPLAEEPDKRWYAALLGRDWDRRLSAFICAMTPLDDPVLRERFGAYFYDKLLRSEDTTAFDPRQLRSLGWKKCEGLGVRYVELKLRQDGRMNLWYLLFLLNNLPGDKEARRAEGRRVYELCARKQVFPAGGLESLKRAVEKLEDEPFTDMNQFT